MRPQSASARTLERLGGLCELFEEGFGRGHGLRDRLGEEVQQRAAARRRRLGVDELVDRRHLEALGIAFVTRRVEEVAEHQDELHKRPGQQWSV